MQCTVKPMTIYFVSVWSTWIIIIVRWFLVRHLWCTRIFAFHHAKIHCHSALFYYSLFSADLIVVVLLLERLDFWSFLFSSNILDINLYHDLGTSDAYLLLSWIHLCIEKQMSVIQARSDGIFLVLIFNNME